MNNIAEARPATWEVKRRVTPTDLLKKNTRLSPEHEK